MFLEKVSISGLSFSPACPPTHNVATLLCCCVSSLATVSVVVRFSFSLSLSIQVPLSSSSLEWLATAAAALSRSLPPTSPGHKASPPPRARISTSAPPPFNLSQIHSHSHYLFLSPWKVYSDASSRYCEWFVNNQVWYKFVLIWKWKSVCVPVRKHVRIIRVQTASFVGVQASEALYGL